MLVIMVLPFITSCGDDEDNNYQNTDIAITGSCKEIGSNYALVEGYFNQKNITASYSSIKIGIEYSDDESFKYSKFIQSNVLEGNKFEVTLTGLNPSTIYYYRTCIKVNEINNVGKTCKFTTNEVEEKDSPEDEGEGEGEGTTTAYFAYQNPVRTLVLGNDIYDNSLDNAHKCRIWATVGGQYNGRNATVNFVVDPTLCDNLWFVDERGNASYRVTPMPTNYYTLSSNTIPYNGDSRGYVEVQFSDAFFNDANSVRNTYVIPLRMTNVTGIDNILTGTSNVESPIRTNEQDWSIQPKDYVLYCVKYMNPWQAKYYRRGVDVITEGGKKPVTIVRKDFTLYNSDPDHYAWNPVNQYDEECGITTKNIKQAIFPATFRISGACVTCNLILTFDGNCCTISTEDEGVTVTGFGEFITKGTERQEYKEYQWESKGRNFDILRLAYNVNFENKNIQVSTNDTLVVKTRESNKKEFFNYMYIK